MIKIAFTIALLTLTLNSIAQKTQKKFDHAYDLYAKKKYDSALYLFVDIYNKGIGNREIIYRSYYFIGLIYMDTKNTSAAKEVYKEMLATDFENPNSAYASYDELWNNPFSQFKHNSCKILAKLALDDSDYKLALTYTKMADTEYPFEHFCGNAHASNDIYLAIMYAKCYEGLGDKEKAIETLLPHCINNGLASNSELVDQLCLLLKEKYTNEKIKQQIESAKAGLYVKEIRYRGDVYQYYYVNIFNTEVEVVGSSYQIDYRKIKELKGIELYQYIFTREEFVKKVLQN